MLKNYAIILGGGSGSRMQKDLPKAFLKINHKYLIEYSILAFDIHPKIDELILVVPESYMDTALKLVKNNNKTISVCSGGNSRFESCKKGVAQILETEAQVLIHDAARPFLSQKLISNSLTALRNHDAVNILIPLKDSLVHFDEQNNLIPVKREDYKQAQTPQSFKLSCIKKAHQLATIDHLKSITDDFNLVLKYKAGSTTWIHGEPTNMKITYADDLKTAEKLFQ